VPIRVFEYGLRAPIVNGELVEQQMRAAHVYRNLLTEMERARRQAVRDVMAAHPDMAPIEARLAEIVARRDGVRKAIATTRGITRSRSESPEQRALARELGSQIRDLRAEIKSNRKAVVEAVKPELDRIEEESLRKRKEARANCGVYWGTYLLQEADADRARQEVFAPKFHAWRGEGRVSVQIQKGITLDELYGQDTQLHIDAVPESAHDPGVRRGDRRRARRTLVRMRVQSDGGKPVWAVWPMRYHRPLPPGSLIKVATISRRRHDCRSWDWLLHITVEIPDAAMRPAPASGVVAINLGFCQRQGGTIRSGYMVADDGTEQEILLPRSVIDAIDKCDSIRSIRDKNMNTLKTQMGLWIATTRETYEKIAREIATDHRPLPPDVDGAWSRFCLYVAMNGPAWPAWFADAAATLHAWRSPDRFRRLAFWWREHRFRGDTIGFNLLEGGPNGTNDWRTEQTSWRYRDEHLERYESGMRRRALLRRRETYRVLAARATAQYRTLLLDDTDLRNFQRSPPPESESVEIRAVKRNRGLAAGSELRLTMVNAFGADRVVKMAPTTKPCHACGTINTWDRREAGRSHQCSHCGAYWDQDANACRNMLAQYAQDLISAQAAPQEEKKPRLSRSQRLRKNRAQSAA